MPDKKELESLEEKEPTSQDDIQEVKGMFKRVDENENVSPESLEEHEPQRKGETIVPPINIAVLDMAQVLCEDCPIETRNACNYIHKGECCPESMGKAQRQYDVMAEKGLITEQGNVFDPNPPRYAPQGSRSQGGAMPNKASTWILGQLLAVFLAVIISAALGYYMLVSKTDFTKNLGNVANSIASLQTTITAQQAKIDSLNNELTADNSTIAVLQAQINGLRQIPTTTTTNK